MGDLPPRRFRNFCQCSGSKIGCVIAKCAPASTFASKRRNLVIQIFRDGIHGDADGEIRRAAESFAGPVGALIQPRQNFDEADGIDFVDAAGFRMIAERWRIARDREDVAHAADGPGAEEHCLQADDIRVARGEMRNRFEAVGFERAGEHERVHSDAGERAAIDVNRIHVADGHDAAHLLDDAVDGNALGRINFHGD